MPSICFVAGDPSGDAHTARLIEALAEKQTALTCTGLGGPAMARAGVTLLDDLTKTAAIGPFDAARHVGRLRRAKRLLDTHLQTHRPDLVVLVNFGDYNLPVIAPLVKRHHIPILYYISPQLWAWGRWRLRYVRRYIDHMAVFFRFEEALYQRAGVPVTWVGHPLIDMARPSMKKEAAQQRAELNPWRMTVGLLPGSRDHEVRRHLPLMLASARKIVWHMPGVQFIIPKAPHLAREAFTFFLEQHPDLTVRLVDLTVADTLQLTDCAIVTSGTATLEAAISRTPMVVVYRTSWPTYCLAKAVVRVPHIALVNIVGGGRVVPELTQHRARPEPIAEAMVELLRSADKRQSVQAALRTVTEALGPTGAVQRAAEVVRRMLPA